MRASASWSAQARGGTTNVTPAIDNATGNPAALFFFQLAFAATAATIVSGAVAERERYVSYILVSAILAPLVYPVVGHWVWAGGILSADEGWLQAMGALDFAGATVCTASAAGRCWRTHGSAWRSLGRRIDQDGERRNLVKGLIKMAHNIGATALSSLGTDVFLGCYSGCPMSEAEFTDWALCGKVRRAT